VTDVGLRQTDNDSKSPAHLYVVIATAGSPRS